MHTHKVPDIITTLRSGTTIEAVSNGSFHPDLQHGTSAWVLCDPISGKTVYGNNLVPGPRSAQCAHRSKLCGLISVVKHVEQLCQQHQVTQGQIEVGCDGEAAYLAATRYNYQPTTCIGHFDLVTKLHHLIKRSPLQWNFRHVTGHQDTKRPHKQLNIWERMNIKADELAKQYLWETLAQGLYIDHVPDMEGCIPTVTIKHHDTTHSFTSYGVTAMHKYLATCRSL